MKKIPEIIVVDDHELFRDGIKTLFQISNIAKIIGEASNGKEFLSLLENTSPDLVLMDIDMPEMDGITATSKALETYPDLKILGLSMFGEHKYYQKMIEAGALGFILKSTSKDELEKAIAKVSNGHSYFSSELIQDMISTLNQSKENKDREDIYNFNDKEVAILNLLCLGYSTDQIAEKIFLSPKTVANYRNNMLSKTNCHNSTHLVFFAIKNNIIEV